jgi:hypothetical protein
MTDTQELVKKLYIDLQGQPIELSEGQDYIFRVIFKKAFPRVHIMCHTRYGKSMTTALAVLTRVSVFPEKWAIVAGTKDKAKIIMDQIIAHIFDNEFTKSRFVPDKGEDLESIRRYKNKNHLTFRTDTTKDGKVLLSEVFIGSAADAMGFGADNIIEDESALIPDDEHAFVMRMLGDNPQKNFMVKIGNPFNRGHFLKSYHDPAYRVINIDCYTSLKEGRMTQATIDEMKQFAFFKILYENVFPSASEIDEEGWMNLLLEDDIKIAEERVVEPFGMPRLGVDVAKGGRNFNTWVLRGDNYARVLLKDHEEDSVKIADKTETYMREYGVLDRAVFVDDTGVGHGVVSILKNRGLKVTAVNFAEKGEGQTLNLRAEAYAGKDGVQPWIKQGAKLYASPEWQELLRIPYKKQPNTGRTQIMPKDDMRKRGIESPDVADALALTFVKPKIKMPTPQLTPAEIAVAGIEDHRPYGGVAFPEVLSNTEGW